LDEKQFMNYEFSDHVAAQESPETTSGRHLVQPSARLTETSGSGQSQTVSSGPSGGFAQTPPVPLYRPAAPLVRPGCVVATSAVFFFMAMTVSCRLISSLAENDLFGVLANFILGVLLVMASVGLIRMYRWAVNLVLLYCIAWSVEFLGTQLISLSILNQNLTHPMSKAVVYGAWFAVSATVILFPTAIFWWFWRKRRSFVGHPLVESWGRAVYVLAAVVMVAGVVASLISATQTLPDALEPQARDLRQIDRQMDELW
jgi:hypothetical protein